VNLDPVRILEFEGLGEMPRDGLALAVGVGCEQNLVRLLGRLTQLPDLLLLAPDDDVLGRKPFSRSTPRVDFGRSRM